MQASPQTEEHHPGDTSQNSTLLRKGTPERKRKRRKKKRRKKKRRGVGRGNTVADPTTPP